MKELLDRLQQFKTDRNWGKHHTESELARAIMIEAGELNELFLWGDCWTMGTQEGVARVKEELADVMIYCLNFCNTAGFDPIEICNDKISQNAVKYPIEAQVMKQKSCNTCKKGRCNCCDCQNKRRLCGNAVVAGKPGCAWIPLATECVGWR